MHISIEDIVEELVGHMIEQHRVLPEQMSKMLSMVEPEDLVGFVVKTHLILHSIEKHGEYQDDQFRFISKDEDV